jgi:orotate phosphoribosyltransferase
MSTTESLTRLLIERSVKRGNFTLASGKSSTIYVDARLTTMSPEGMVLIGSLALEEIDRAGWDPDSVGGLTLGADPIAYAISHESASRAKPLRAFTVRKDVKTHGTGKRIEGPFAPDDKVVIVEDVITTGKSALQAIEAVQDAGGRVVGVLAVVDREEGGQEAIRALGHEVASLVRLSDLTSS